ncbi:MAG: MFS transporter [Peptostreptococcaceae bacterium]
MQLILFRLFYFFLFFGVANVNGMLIPFLRYKGYDPIHIGTLISLYTISGILGQLSVGYFCDKLKTIKKIFLPAVLISIISGMLAILFKRNIIFYVGFFIMGFFSGIVISLADSWVIENDDTIKAKFGQLRAFGSIGWAFGVLVMGYALSKLGIYAMGIIFFVSMAVAFIATIKSNDISKKCKGTINIKNLITNKEYLFTIIIFLFISISFRSYYQIIPYAIELIGGNASNIGLYYFIGSISEIIMLLLCSKIMHRLSPDKLLRIVPIAILVQIMILYIARSIIFIYISALLQIFTYPILLMCGRIMIDRISPSELRTTSQLIGFAIFNSFGVVVASFTIGVLIEKFNINNTMLIVMAWVIFCIICSIFYDKKTKDKTL